MKNKNLFVFGAGLGLLAGYYLNTDKGRKMRQAVADEVKAGASSLSDQGSEVLQKATDLVADLRRKGESYLAEMKENSNNTKRDLERYVEKEVSDMKKKLLADLESSVKSQ